MINVMIVDDHDLVRAGISEMLKKVSNIKVVGQAKTGEEAISMAREKHPDVILMDVKMPGIGGLEATRRLLKFLPDAKILIVTVCDDDVFPVRLLQAGAVGYLTKGASMDEMIQAIRSVSVGQRVISPEIARQLALKHLGGEEKGEPLVALSERELQVMIMITKGMKVTAISDSLHLSPKTINSYRYRIFEKLGVSNDVELTLLAIRHGIMDSDEIANEEGEGGTVATG